MPRSHPILECSYEYLLVRVDELNGRLIEVDEIFPRIFRRALNDVEKVGGDHDFVPACSKLMDLFLHQVLEAGGRELRQAHIPC